GQVLCLGAGGAGVATLLHLVNQIEPADRPARFIAVDRDPARLDHMRQMAQQFETDITVDYVCTSAPRQNDALLAQLPPGSLVINATGMGKDTPGSPLTDAAVFPQNGIAWEFNYRGELDFMHQALRQKEARNLRVEDGWLYFLHGWSQVIAQVLHLELTEALFAQLNESAAATRS
ncbi:MAG: shikimate dehydrogenase, partial [Anaerolineae bacterium]|nr:shikimate dehydrogenase [Anaerolineae bacterium]